MDEDEPRRLSRSEQKRLVEALKIALMRCQNEGADDEIWRGMLYAANLGVEPENLGRMRNLLKAIVGQDPIEEGAHSQRAGRPDRRRSKDRRPSSPTLARAGKVDDHTPATYEHGKSDRPILLAKPSNKARQLAAEVVEEREGA